MGQVRVRCTGLVGRESRPVVLLVVVVLLVLEGRSAAQA